MPPGTAENACRRGRREALRATWPEGGARSHVAGGRRSRGRERTCMPGEEGLREGARSEREKERARRMGGSVHDLLAAASGAEQRGRGRLGARGEAPAGEERRAHGRRRRCQRGGARAWATERFWRRSSRVCRRQCRRLARCAAPTTHNPNRMCRASLRESESSIACVRYPRKSYVIHTAISVCVCVCVRSRVDIDI